MWKEKSFAAKPKTCPWAAILCFAVGFAALAFWFVKRQALVENDYLTLAILAFFFFVSGIYLLSQGNNLFSAAGFPIAFLVFLIPFPSFLTNWIEMFFQHASASAAYAMLQISDAPV